MEVIKEFFNGDVKVIKYPVYGDHRGNFREVFEKKKFRSLGIKATFVQDNLSISPSNVFRGMHIQLAKPQAKYVHCITGHIIDYFIDLRKDSKTFGKCESVELTEGHAVFIPKMFGHGFHALGQQNTLYYKCDDYYHPKSEISLNPRPFLSMANLRMKLSEKDEKGISLKEFKKLL